MKNVLIPTDFSESANLASELGVQIAKKLHTGVTFLHLISTPVEWRKLPLEKEAQYPETKAAIGDAKDKLHKLERKAENNGVEATGSLVFNTGIEEIQKYINKNNSILVVMGTHGQTGLKRVIGTNTLKVIHKSPVPVLAVKAPYEPTVPKHWVIVSDFQEESKEEFDTLMQLAKNLEASVDVLYVNTPYYFAETPEIREKMEGFLSRYPDMAGKKQIIDAHNEERGIGSFAKECDCELIAVITHGKAGLTPLFRRSITERLLNNLDLPVLSINSNT